MAARLGYQLGARHLNDPGLLMLISVPRLARPIDRDSFADLTSVPVLRVITLTTGGTVEFDGDVDAATRAEVAARCSTPIDGDDLRATAAEALSRCETFLALPAPTSADAVAQIRLLTQVTMRLVRLALRRNDGMD